MQYILKDGSGRFEEPALHPRFELGPDDIHPVHAAQQGGLVAVCIGTGDPEPDPCAVAVGEDALEVRVRAHHIVSGLHHRFILFEGVDIPPEPEARAAFHPRGLEDLPAKPERHIRVLPDLQPVEAHQAQQGEGVLGLKEAVFIMFLSAHSSLFFVRENRILNVASQGASRPKLPSGDYAPQVNFGVTKWVPDLHFIRHFFTSYNTPKRGLGRLAFGGRIM